MAKMTQKELEYLRDQSVNKAGKEYAEEELERRKASKLSTKAKNFGAKVGSAFVSVSKSAASYAKQKIKESQKKKRGRARKTKQADPFGSMFGGGGKGGFGGGFSGGNDLFGSPSRGKRGSRNDFFGGGGGVSGLDFNSTLWGGSSRKKSKRRARR